MAPLGLGPTRKHPLLCLLSIVAQAVLVLVVHPTMRHHLPCLLLVVQVGPTKKHLPWPPCFQHHLLALLTMRHHLSCLPYH